MNAKVKKGLFLAMRAFFATLWIGIGIILTVTMVKYFVKFVVGIWRLV